MTATSVLIADDNAPSLEVMSLVLEMHGFDVHRAKDGLEAYSMAVALQPDVVILDLTMPGLSGEEVAQKIRERQGKMPRLVALSGHDQHASQLGDLFDGYFQKPVSADQLVAAATHR